MEDTIIYTVQKEKKNVLRLHNKNNNKTTF